MLVCCWFAVACVGKGDDTILLELKHMMDDEVAVAWTDEHGVIHHPAEGEDVAWLEHTLGEKAGIGEFEEPPDEPVVDCGGGAIQGECVSLYVEATGRCQATYDCAHPYEEDEWAVQKSIIETDISGRKTSRTLFKFTAINQVSHHGSCASEAPRCVEGNGDTPMPVTWNGDPIAFPNSPSNPLSAASDGFQDFAAAVRGRWAVDRNNRFTDHEWANIAQKAHRAIKESNIAKEKAPETYCGKGFPGALESIDSTFHFWKGYLQLRTSKRDGRAKSGQMCPDALTAWTVAYGRQLTACMKYFLRL